MEGFDVSGFWENYTFLIAVGVMVGMLAAWLVRGAFRLAVAGMRWVWNKVASALLNR